MPGNSLYRRIVRAALLVMVVALLAGAATADSALAIAVTRQLPTSAIPGTTLDVRIAFSAPQDNFNAIGIIEQAPSGWNVTINDIWCNPRPFASKSTNNVAELIWEGPFPRGTAFSVVYQVTVPASITTGRYSFNGKLEYYIGGGGSSIIDDVTGVVAVSVEGTIPPPTTVVVPPVVIPPVATPTPTPPPAVIPPPAPIPSPTPSPSPTAAPAPKPTPGPPGTPKPSFNVSFLGISATEVNAGEQVVVTCQLTNSSSERASQPVVLKVNGEPESTRDVTLNAGSSERLTFTISRTTPDSYTVDVEGVTTTFRVKQVPIAAPKVSVPRKTAPSSASSQQQDMTGWLITGGVVLGIMLCALFIYLIAKRRAKPRALVRRR